MLDKPTSGWARSRRRRSFHPSAMLRRSAPKPAWEQLGRAAIALAGAGGASLGPDAIAFQGELDVPAAHDAVGLLVAHALAEPRDGGSTFRLTELGRRHEAVLEVLFKPELGAPRIIRDILTAVAFRGDLGFRRADLARHVRARWLGRKRVNRRLWQLELAGLLQRNGQPRPLSAGEPDASLRLWDRGENAILLELGSAADVAEARRLTAQAAHTAGFAPADVDDLVLVASELATNGLVHGSAPRTLTMHVANGSFVIELLNCPGASAPDATHAGDGLPEGGRGLGSVAHLMDLESTHLTRASRRLPADTIA